jgi:MoaA/NifB/PqqE/SkfB family radical SAM enzyme
MDRLGLSVPTGATPRVAFRELRSLWLQVTGTLCNLACTHCLNASGPRAPWLASLDAETVHRALAEAEALGVKEIYFTGGEPFLHPEILALLDASLAIGPTTVLTNGTLIDEALAGRLGALAAGSLYSLEIRVSLDGATAGENDRVRGSGTFARALDGLRALAAHGLLPIVTATDVRGDPTLYARLRDALLAAGLARPRIKILPLLPAGRAGRRMDVRTLTADELDGFDERRLMCTETRVVAAGGVYACPILAGLDGARVGATLRTSFGSTPLYHPACRTCRDTGLVCTN